MVSIGRGYFLVKHFFVLLITYFCFSYSLELSAQTSINSTQFIEQYLLDVQKDFQLTTLPATFQSPWIEGIELRTQTREFDIDQQRFQIRFRPIPKKIRSAQQRVSQLLQEETAFKRTSYFQDFIKEAYEQWLKIRSLYQQNKIQQAMLVVYQDIEKVLLKMGQVEQLNVKELLEVQSDITNTTIAIETLQEAINAYTDASIISDSDLLPITAIHSILQSKDIAPMLLGKEQLNELALVQAEIDLERAEQQNILDFIQFQYQGPTKDPWEERVAISASINIPFSKKGNLKEAELQMEQALLEEEFYLDNVQSVQELNKLKQRTIRLIGQYERSQDLLLAQQERTNELLAKMAAQSTTSPLLALYQQVEKYKQSLDLLKLESAVYQEYIDYLEEAGLLYQTPFRNFLVEGN